MALRRRTHWFLIAAITSAAPSGYAVNAEATTQALPTLIASAVVPGASAPQNVRLRLDGFSPDTYQVIERPSAASVLLGYPATETRRVHGHTTEVRAKPCAQIRLALSLQPPTASPLDYVSQIVPNPVRQGQEVDPSTATTPVQAWNLFSTIQNSRTLRVRAVGARTFAKDGLTGLIRLDMEARTIGNRLPCASPSHYTLGPNILGVLSMAD